MGCSASAIDPNTANGSDPHIKMTDEVQNGHVTSEYGREQLPKHSGTLTNGDLHKDNEHPLKVQNASHVNLTTKPPLPKSIAFEVLVESNNNINTILSKNPPKRLERLVPLHNAPKLSAELLQEKIKQAEEKRNKELERKRQISRKSSKLRNNILQAQEFEMTLQHQIETKQSSAGKNREMRRLEMESRKRIREERAKRARERAKKIQVEAEEMEFDIEKDDNFNACETDSWLGDDETMTTTTDLPSDFGSRVNSGSERIYSGRESPMKAYNAEVNTRMASAGTTDSFDYAFQREPLPVEPETEDNFFDT